YCSAARRRHGSVSPKGQLDDRQDRIRATVYGRAGGLKQRTARQREWDQKYGDGQWAVGYVVDGAFVLQEDALESIYNRSYEEHFAAHPDDLDELIRLAKTLRNPH